MNRVLPNSDGIFFSTGHSELSPFSDRQKKHCWLHIPVKSPWKPYEIIKFIIKSICAPHVPSFFTLTSTIPYGVFIFFFSETILSRSDRNLPCDIAVVGAGAVPNVDFCPPEQGRLGGWRRCKRKQKKHGRSGRWKNWNHPSWFLGGETCDIVNDYYNLSSVIWKR